MRGGILPNGETTKSDSKYVEEWRKFCIPIEEALGMYHWAFDPGVSFRTNDENHSISLPRWFIQRFNDLVISEHKDYPKIDKSTVKKNKVKCSCFGEETEWLCPECSKEYWKQEIAIRKGG